MDTQTKERYEMAVEGLGQAITRLAEIGEFWGDGGAIALDDLRRQYVAYRLGRAEDATLLSDRSLLYCAAGENARECAAGAFFLDKIWWNRKATSCFKKALNLTHQFAAVAFFKEMTPEKREVWSRILRKNGRHKDALACINEAFKQGDMSANTRVLLLIGEAESYAALRDFYIPSTESTSAYGKALALQDKVPIDIQVRLLKSYAAYQKSCGWRGTAEKSLQRAETLIVLEKLKQQTLQDTAQISKLEQELAAKKIY